MGFHRLSGGAPAAVVDAGELAGDLAAAVAQVGLARAVVVVDLGDAAVDVGVDPDHVLAVGAVVALVPKLADGVREVVVAGRREPDVEDVTKRTCRTPPVSPALPLNTASAAAAQETNEEAYCEYRSALSAAWA
jgi:hypothetical protein